MSANPEQAYHDTASSKEQQKCCMSCETFEEVAARFDSAGSVSFAGLSSISLACSANSVPCLC